MARSFEASQREALESGNTEKAARDEQLGQLFLMETQNFSGRFIRGGFEPKRIVSDEEAARLRAEADARKQAAEDAEHLAKVRKKIGLDSRANAFAHHPYRGGLPTLGKRR
jgi:hypothetical protein